MDSPRIFCATSLADARGADLDLPAAAARHVAQALRMRAGDALTLFNGEGGEFAATIARIDKRGVAVRVGAFDPVERELAHRVTLVQSIIAADMMDLVVRKAVELGAAAIVPVIAERSQRAPEARAMKRVDRWRQIAVSACEQCGRNRVPRIDDVVALSEWFEQTRGGPEIVALAVEAPTSLAAMLRRSVPRYIVVGPEGGFTPREMDDARRRDLSLARLGPAILRAETAALAALATVGSCATT